VAKETGCTADIHGDDSIPGAMNPTDLLESWLSRTRLPTGTLMGIALFLGFLATGINAFIQHLQITAHHLARFQSQANVALEQAAERMQSDVALLQGGVALYGASTAVEREDFRAYVQALGLAENFPGVATVGFAPHVAHRDLPTLVDRAARQGVAGYEVRAWGSGEATGPFHAPVWFAEPYAGLNARLLGRDLLTDPALAESLSLARRSGMATMSGQVVLDGENGEDPLPSVMLLFPVFEKGQPHITEAQREAAILGYAFVVLRVSDLLAGMGAELGVDLEVFDGPDMAPAKLLFDTDRHRIVGGGYPGRFAERHEIRTFAQRTWTWYTGSMPAFEAGIDYKLVYLMGGGGLLTTSLVALLIGYLGSRRQLAEKRAHVVTERLRERNQALWNTINELEYQKSVLDIHAIVSITDYKGDITYVNDKFCEISGYSREELLGRNHRLVNSSRHPKAFFDLMWATIVSGEVWQGEICNRSKDGREYWVKTTIVPFLDENGVPERFVSARTDITALKKARDELQRHRDNLHELVEARTREAMLAKEQAEAAYRAKSQFLANMSHELRTPIHAVLSYSELGESKADRVDFTGDKARHYFQRIHQSGQRLLGLINDLLDLSKMEAGHMRYQMGPADMHQVIGRVGDDLAGLMSAKGLRLDISPCPPGHPVVFDPVRMEQVVVNLLSNAIRFSPDGGCILIRCEEIQMPGRRADDLPSAGLRVSVSDQGPGIPADELESIFEKFVQASHSRSGAGGTGLGLAICREILHAHRGRIWAENLPDGGAQLVFEFPCHLPATHTA
jgi:PAS domain S-box-containing protein